MARPKCRFLLLIVFALLILCSSASFAGIVYVKWDSPNDGPGNDWDHAFHSVQAGLDAAVSGDEVWVAGDDGHPYVENITLVDGVGLYGGFADTETSRDQRDWNANVTILDGNQRGSVVTVPAGASFSTTVDGFIIRNGGTCGIRCSGSSAMITNNTITGNSASLGGGIFCYFSSSVISNNTITGNSASSGGGICCDESSSLTITNNLITLNLADRGGAISSNSSSTVITNNTITGNSASEGGAIRVGGRSSSLELVNNIVAFNSSGIYVYSGTASLRDNCVYGNTDYDYSGLPDPTGTDGNISVDPQLADLQYGNVHIEPGSPCVDAGDDSAVAPGSLDIDGQPRQNGVVDIGADESYGESWPVGPYVIVRVSPDGNDTNDGSSWALAKRTVQAGIDAASAQGGEVWVAAGVYYEHMVLPPHAHLYGGFAGTETTREERDWASNATILDGKRACPVLTVRTANIFSTIDGFTIRNGYAYSYELAAGGIHCDHSSPTITNNTITLNASYWHGGGIYCDHSSPTITNNTITSNGADNGAGIYCVSSSPMIANNTITGNNASYGGATMMIGSSSSPGLVNNIVAFNSSGIYNWGTPTLRNNCVYGNTEYDYSGLPDPTGTDGNISVDPQLAHFEYGNVHIQPGSPCVDAGDDTAVAPGSLDIDGQPRQNGVVDIGADESYGESWPAGPYAIVRVSPDGDDSNDGSSWALAKRTVQAGIDTASAQGGEVWVAAGVYYEWTVLPAYTCLYGGFAGTETTSEERDWTSNVTVLDGQHGRSVVTVPAGSTFSTIDGFMIRNGSAGRYGGGIYCGSYSSPTITNNTITGNHAVYPADGGGIYCSTRSATIANNTITGNSANQRGGGIYCGSCTITNNTITGNTASEGGGIYCGSSTITNNMIAGNSASSRGGGICCRGFSPTIAGNAIVDNTASASGGGIYCSYSSASITNNTITGNSTSSSGGGICCSSSRSATIANNTITGNSALSLAGGIYCWGYYYTVHTLLNNIVAFNSSGIYNSRGDPKLRNNCVYGNAEYDYSGISAGVGDISLDPLFVDPANGNYRLLWISPCVDAGTNDGAPAWDLDGNPRPVDGNIDGLALTDIGAYEYQVMSVTTDVLPGDSANVIKVKPNRPITVAIIADGFLHLGLINVATITFGPSMAAYEVHSRGHWGDVNGDGRLDLVLHFRCGETGIQPGDRSVMLRGRLNTGEPFVGSDTLTAR